MPNKTYNILVVEDEWINANFITQILETLNQEVVGVASSAKEAQECLKKHEVDFIFMDINIDGAQDGITLAHKINQTKNIPIIYMTAFGDSDTIEEASQTNIYGFIIKPFMEKDVEAVLNVAIQRAKKELQEKESAKQTSKLNLGFNYIFDLDKSTLYFKNNTITLSKNETKLLHLLSLNQGHIVSSEEIRQTIWGEKEVGESTIRDTILRVRKKILPLRLENIASVGYILKKEIES